MVKAFETLPWWQKKCSHLGTNPPNDTIYSPKSPSELISFSTRTVEALRLHPGSVDDSPFAGTVPSAFSFLPYPILGSLPTVRHAEKVTSTQGSDKEKAGPLGSKLNPTAASFVPFVVAFEQAGEVGTTPAFRASLDPRAPVFISGSNSKQAVLRSNTPIFTKPSRPLNRLALQLLIPRRCRSKSAPPVFNL